MKLEVRSACLHDFQRVSDSIIVKSEFSEGSFGVLVSNLNPGFCNLQAIGLYGIKHYFFFSQGS